MTPPPDSEPICPSDCFLYERTGGVCPMVRDDGLAAAEAARQADVLRTLVFAEAHDTPSLIELVRLDAARSAGVLRVPSRLALPVATAQPIPDHSRKEIPNVISARSPR
jgi:hypothetical protein